MKLIITLRILGQRWEWFVEDYDSAEDVISGICSDYNQACADALAAHDDMMERRK